MIVTRLVNWLSVPMILFVARLISGATGLAQGLLLIILAVLLSGSGLILWGTIKMRQLESYGLARMAAVLAMVIGPG